MANRFVVVVITRFLRVVGLPLPGSIVGLHLFQLLDWFVAFKAFVFAAVAVGSWFRSGDECVVARYLQVPRFCDRVGKCDFRSWTRADWNCAATGDFVFHVSADRLSSGLPFRPGQGFQFCELRAFRVVFSSTDSGSDCAPWRNTPAVQRS